MICLQEICSLWTGSGKGDRKNVIISEDEDSEGGTEEGRGDEGKGDSSLCLTPPPLSDEEPEEPKSRPR